jgi:hypothetical protein
MDAVAGMPACGAGRGERYGGLQLFGRELFQLSSWSASCTIAVVPLPELRHESVQGEHPATPPGAAQLIS